MKRKHEHKDMTSQRFVPCPEPQKVEAYLREALDAELFGGDLVCYSCYRYCQQILTSEACTFSSEVIIKNLNKITLRTSFQHLHQNLVIVT